MSVFPSIHTFTHLSYYLHICISTHSSTHLSIHPCTITPYVYLPSIRLAAYPSVHGLFLHLSIFHYLAIYLSTPTNMNPFKLPSMHASICPPTHSYLLSLPIHLSNYPLIHPPIHLLGLHIRNCSLSHSTMHLSLCTYSLHQSHAHSPILSSIHLPSTPTHPPTHTSIPSIHTI